jgi:hypothetical protein
MSAPAKAATLPQVPPEVLSFAAEKGVSDFVVPVLEMTARAFAGCPLKMFVEYDYEEPEWQYIVVAADVTGYSTEQAVAAQHWLSAEYVRTVPAAFRQYFVSGMG